jgi:hypothetical protein
VAPSICVIIIPCELFNVVRESAVLTGEHSLTSTVLSNQISHTFHRGQDLRKFPLILSVSFFSENVEKFSFQFKYYASIVSLPVHCRALKDFYRLDQGSAEQSRAVQDSNV